MRVLASTGRLPGAARPAGARRRPTTGAVAPPRAGEKGLQWRLTSNLILGLEKALVAASDRQERSSPYLQGTEGPAKGGAWGPGGWGQAKDAGSECSGALAAGLVHCTASAPPLPCASPGNFAPVADELHQMELEVVEGALPAALDGAFLRNGPNPALPATGGYHWWVALVGRGMAARAMQACI